MIAFLILKWKHHVDKHLKFLNNKHKTITITVEHELNNNIPFLDLMITKVDNKLSKDVYIKIPTQE